ncbi:MAG: DUF1343 domain-containing protein [Spirochaetota bacterium]|nr:DUF1343 domain-containing protein [Spirochaetota bacterium]
MTQTGLNRLLTDKLSSIKGYKLGVLCHPASVNENYQHIIELLYQNKDLKLTTILAPQHGFMGDKQDNMIESNHLTDPLTNLPVYSLYSETRMPTREMLKDIDILIIDLQDVGTRVYTFIYTMAFCLEACKKYGKKVIVLDRPNPINASTVEGNILDLEFKSFVGQYPIPMRHGMTIAELALLFNSEYNIFCELEIIAMTNYKRPMWFDDTCLPWVYPSPNMPTLDTATVYPGGVLFEGTLLSEGRGTTKPFEIIGSPYINSQQLIEEINLYKLAGVYFRPIYFEPCFHKFSGKLCAGIQIHVIDRNIFKPYLTGLAIIKAIIKLYPNNFEWKQAPYEYEYIKLPIDLLIGNQNIRKKLHNNTDLYYIESSWLNNLNDFLNIRNKYLLYPEQ